MTQEELAAAARRVVERTCAEQGVPVHVEDPAVLGRIAALIWSELKERDRNEPAA